MASRAGKPPTKPHSSSKANKASSLFNRESFDNIYLDLSKESGKCRFAETGFGWKPSGGGDTFTLDHTNIGSAQWSRAAKGYEVKILLRNSGILQLDGFIQEVSLSIGHSHDSADGNRISSASAKFSKTGIARTLSTKSTHSADGTGAKASLARPN